MYARLARWEDADAAAMRSMADRINAEPGPPEGVPAKGLLMLMDPDRGCAMAIALFDSEEDRRRGDETLNAMSPPVHGMGRRTAVEMYEVGVDVRAPAGV